jgi:hypothetical protein
MPDAHPQFKVFYGKGKRPGEEAAISIHRTGSLHLNRAAYAMLAEPQAVELSFDERLKIVGLRGVAAEVEHAYAVQRDRERASYAVSATAFCTACKIDRGQARRYKATRYGEHIGIDLTAPIAVTSRSAAASTKMKGK